MVSGAITEEFVRRVTADLRDRYALDADEVRLLASHIASARDASREVENRAFAARFTERHRKTFDRLAR